MLYQGCSEKRSRNTNYWMRVSPALLRFRDVGLDPGYLQAKLTGLPVGNENAKSLDGFQVERFRVSNKAPSKYGLKRFEGKAYHNPLVGYGREMGLITDTVESACVA